MTTPDNQNITPGPGEKQNALHAFLAKKQSNEPEAETRYESEMPDSMPAEAHTVVSEPQSASETSAVPEKNDGHTIKGIANVLSAIFSPLFAPTFALVAALWITPLAHASEQARFSSAAVVFFITAIIPLGVIITLMRMGKVSDLAISDRRQRSVPFAVTGCCYFGASLYLHLCHAPAWLCMFFIGAGVAAICALFISLKWKISAHLLGMGGMCGMLVWLAAHRFIIIAPIPWIIGAIVLSGAVASSRIYLGRHTPAQTYAGWALGLLLAIVAMSL